MPRQRKCRCLVHWPLHATGLRKRRTEHLLGCSDCVAAARTPQAGLDPSGQRWAKIEHPTDVTLPTQATVYLGDTEITDTDTYVNDATPDVTATRFFTFGGSTVATEIATEGAATVPFFFLFGDYQGSAQLMMPDLRDGSGDYDLPESADHIQRNAYTPYGAQRDFDPGRHDSPARASANPLTIERGWLSQVADEATSSLGTGLTYLNARYYDPVASRFISPDPMLDVMDPKTLDPYRYAENNPVSYSDATGLAANCSGLTGLAATYCTSSSNSTGATTTARAKPWHNSATTDSGTGSHLSNACLKFADRAGCPERAPGFNPFSWVGDVADRGSTYVQYLVQSSSRRANNPLQTIWDTVTLTTAAETVSAWEAIVVEDGELVMDDKYCGREFECIQGVYTTNESDGSAWTIGHTARYKTDGDLEVGTVIHELDHTYNFENFGGVGFGGRYLGEYVVCRSFGGGDDPCYQGISFERHARDRSDGHEPRGILSELFRPDEAGDIVHAISYLLATPWDTDR